MDLTVLMHIKNALLHNLSSKEDWFADSPHKRSICTISMYKLINDF